MPQLTKHTIAASFRPSRINSSDARCASDGLLQDRSLHVPPGRKHRSIPVVDHGLEPVEALI